MLEYKFERLAGHLFYKFITPVTGFKTYKMSKKRFTEPEIHKILEEFKNDTTISSIIEKYGISQATFYNWRSKYSKLSSSEMVQQSTLKEDNERLKLMFAELSLENLKLKAQLRMLKDK